MAGVGGSASSQATTAGAAGSSTTSGAAAGASSTANATSSGATGTTTATTGAFTISALSLAHLAATAPRPKRTLQTDTSFTAPEGTYRCVASLVAPTLPQTASSTIADDSGKSETGTDSTASPSSALGSTSAPFTPSPAAGNTASPGAPAPAQAHTVLALSQASALAWQQYQQPLPHLSCVSVKFPLSKGKEKEQARAARLAEDGSGTAYDDDADFNLTTSGTLIAKSKVGAGLRRGMSLGKGFGGGGSAYNDHSASGVDVPAHLRNHASWTRALVEATLTAQGIDFPAQSVDPPLAAIAEHRESSYAAATAAAAIVSTAADAAEADNTSNPEPWTNYGLGLSSSTSGAPTPLTPTSASQTGSNSPHSAPISPLSTLLSPPVAASSVASLPRPKNGMRGATSQFVTRFITHPELSKLLSARNGTGDCETFAFVSVGKTLCWMLDAGGMKVKEPLARIGFSTFISAHDVNCCTKSWNSLDVIVGFQTGDLIWVDPIAAKYSRINKGGVITKSPVTMVKWLPGSEFAFLAAHADGTVIVYETGREDSAGPGKETGFFPKTTMPVYARQVADRAGSFSTTASGTTGGAESLSASTPGLTNGRGAFQLSSARDPMDDAQEVLAVPDLPITPTTEDPPHSPIAPLSPSTATTSTGSGGGSGSSFFRRPNLGRSGTATSHTATTIPAGGAANKEVSSALPPGLSDLTYQDVMILGGHDKLAVADVWEPESSMLVTRPGLPTSHPYGPNSIDVAALTGTAIGTPYKAKEPTWSKVNPVSHWKVSKSKITDMAFSPDASLLALTSEDGSLRIVDVQQERLLDTFGSYFGGFTCTCWSPDGLFLAAGGQDDLITILSPRDGRVIARCQGHSSFITSIAFDPWRWSVEDRTYRFGSVGEDGKLLLWDFSSATLHRPKSHAHALGAGAHRASAMGSTFSLVDRFGRRGSAPINDTREGEDGAGGATVHTAPPRSETAMLQPITSHQLEGDTIGIILQLRFRPEGITIIHRDGGLDTFLRPGVRVTALTGQPPSIPSSDTTLSKRPSSSAGASTGARNRGFSFGLRKNTSDAAILAK